LLTQALEFLIVIFISVSLVAVLYDYFGNGSESSNGKWDLISLLFTILTIMTVIFEKLAVIEWIKEKKDYERKTSHEIIFMIVEILFLIPTPSIFIG
jgi:heme/copper-type cytochrome/quinol oxidase subunit 4